MLRMQCSICASLAIFNAATAITNGGRSLQMSTIPIPVTGKNGIVGVEVHENGEGSYAMPLGLHNVRSRRLATGGLMFESVPLVPGYGTHIAYVYVGSPPQRVSVIVDTGSHFTAFPCVGCRACGTHTDPYWDQAASSTAVVPGCNECDSGFSCSAGKCTFSQSYSEGSSWSAFEVKDKLYTGDISLLDTPAYDSQFTVDFMFGCIMTQTGLFNSQLADGIMGMSASDPTLVWQLKKAGILTSVAFSLCFDLDGGVMVLGAGEPLLWKQPMQYTPMLHDSGWYTVQLLDIKIGGTSIGVDPSIYQRGKGVIVDSGTTDTYLPSDCASGFKAAWNKLTGMTYSNNAVTLSAAAFNKLPAIDFIMAGGVTVTVTPEAFMESSEDGKHYTSRIYLDEGAGAVLGANFMKDHDVLFDAQEKRVGFAPANCKWDALKAAKEAAAAVTEAPTAGTTQSADCPIEPEMKMILKCSARCPLGAPSASVQTGVELWVQTYAAGALPTCDQTLLTTEDRPCELQCIAGPVNPTATTPPTQFDDLTGTCETAWTDCSASCSQSRSVLPSSQGGTGTECTTEVRTCATGITCPAASQGLIVAGAVVLHMSTPAFTWSGRNSDSFTAALSGLIRMGQNSEPLPAGDLEVFSIASGGEGSSQGRIDVAFGVHLYPAIDADKAGTVVQQLQDSALGGQLTKLLKKDSSSKFGPTLVAAELPRDTVSILSASDHTAYVGRSASPGFVDGENATDKGGGSVGAGGGISLIAAVLGGLVVCVLGGAVLARKGKSRGEGNYRIVNGQRAGTRGSRPADEFDDEFETDVSVEMSNAHRGSAGSFV